MNGISELASLFKERENKITMGIQIGKVIAPAPHIKIALGNKIILDKENLIIAAQVLSNYSREFYIENTTDVTSETDSASVQTHGEHSHNLENFSVKGVIKWTDSLKKNDEVILIPTTDEQKFFLIDKAVRL